MPPAAVSLDCAEFRHPEPPGGIRTIADNHDVTDLIVALRNGDPGALDALFGALYDELRRVAHRQLAGQDGAHTLSATAVVHEVYLELQGPGAATLQDRAHFLTLAARAMRQVLVDYARARLSKKRGGGARRTVLDEAEIRVNDEAETIVALDPALDRLQATDERLAQGARLPLRGPVRR